MKKYISIAIALLLAVSFNDANAQERVYVSTDKECYLAGEPLWFSVYCMEGAGLSNMSKVAYLEFHAGGQVLSTVKVALKEGRGCGRFQIPFSVPTGNCSRFR